MGLSAIPAAKARHWGEALALIALAFAVWRPDFIFFWRDDWNMLDGLRDAGAAYYFKHHFGHVEPLFKLLYRAELEAFGTRTSWYAHVNVLLFGLTNVAVLRLLQRSATPVAAWAVAILLTVHPIMYQHLGWIFEQCATAHLLLQVLAVLTFMRWMDAPKGRLLWGVAGLTVAQNYFFGNGLFLPLVFAAGIAIRLGPGQRLRPMLPFIALFIAFAAVQLALGGDRGTKGLGLAAVPGMVIGAAHLLGVNAARAVAVDEWALGGALPWLAALGFAGLAAVAVARRDRDRRRAVVLLLWFGASFCSIPIVRGEGLLEQRIPYYYSVLSLTPMVLLAEHALGGRAWWGRVPRALMLGGCGALLVAVLAVDSELRRMLSFFHFRNEQLMMKSLEDGTPYYGLDDPYFSPTTYRVEDPAGIYAYWRARNRFAPVAGYEKDPANWTREETLCP